MNEKYRKICEELGWAVHECDDGTVELEQGSPAGEDFIVSVDSEGFARNIEEYAADFDVDEHVELWAGSRGKNGVPSSIRKLVEDAEAIDNMLQELAAALAEVEDEEDAR